MTIKIGSLFAGIGGFELGIERAIPNSETVWQVEQDKYCQTILKKHWPGAEIFDDIRQVNSNNLKPVDILLGGFPCQDISTAAKQEGIHEGKKSSLYWELLRVICEIRPRVIILENVSALVNRGLSDVLGSLAEIGYDAEWICITAEMFGAPHRRERIFIVAYSRSSGRDNGRYRLEQNQSGQRNQSKVLYEKRKGSSTDFNRTGQSGTSPDSFSMFEQISFKREQSIKQESRSFGSYGTLDFWKEGTPESPICGMDDGIPFRVARLKALGNAIVPQCSQWIGEQVYQSGILDNPVRRFYPEELFNKAILKEEDGVSYYDRDILIECLINSGQCEDYLKAAEEIDFNMSEMGNGFPVIV
jgi:DNA (cytosine-5)-methyltransferase 1